MGNKVRFGSGSVHHEPNVGTGVKEADMEPGSRYRSDPGDRRKQSEPGQALVRVEWDAREAESVGVVD